MKRKLLATLLTLCMAVSLFGCGSKPAEEAAPAPAEKAEAEAETEAEVESRALSVASIAPANSVMIKATEYMADGLREATGGALDMQIYSDSTLGGQVEYLEGLSMGTVDMCIISSSALEDFYDQFAIYGIPFLWRDGEHITNFLNSDLGQELNANFLERTGLRVLTSYDEGARQVWTNNKPVESLADFKGLALRVPEITLYIESFNGLGANATILPLGDVYTGMQTGLVDGFELPISGTFSTSLYEQAKYCTMTNHIEDLVFVLINEDVWQSFTAEQQAAMQEWADKAAVKDRELFEVEVQEYRKTIEESGVEFIEMSAEERDKLVAALDEVITKLYDGVIDPAMLDEIRGM